MSNQLFEEVIYNSIPRNNFDLSHDKKMSVNMGRLYPILTQEVVPGDSFNVQQEQLVRMAPMVAPIMHRVNVSTHFFFVPNRILWEGFEDFITNPTDPLNPAPYLPSINNEVGSLGDYLGYPTGEMGKNNGGAMHLNPFPISAYYKIQNDYYRDQNIQTLLPYELVDGDNTGVIPDPFKNKPHWRAWNKDYFTSSLPFAQKGEPVSIPMLGSADVNYRSAGNTSLINQATGLSDLPDNQNLVTSNPLGLNTSIKVGANFANVDNSSNLEVDLTSATAITVENLRRALRLQEWLEINARSGSRYVEYLQAQYGVKSSDGRLQRAEYLGGGKSNISFSEVLQMSSSDATTPQGNMAGHGINVGNSNSFRRSFEEHGWIIGIMSIMPETAYMNATPKWVTKLDPLEYLIPKFAQLGEQPVFNYEVQGDLDYTLMPEDVFGYQSKYAEYKSAFNTVHGDFKNNMDFWHMARKFDPFNPILLNEEFIQSDPTHRIFAVEDEDIDKLYVLLYNRVKVLRALPRNNIPTT